MTTEKFSRRSFVPSSLQALRMRFFLSIPVLSLLLLTNADLSQSQDLPDVSLEAAQDSVEDQRANLQLIALPTPDGVILRWSPTTPRAWHFANTTGYIVERFSKERALGDVLRQGGVDIDSLLTPRTSSSDENTQTVDGQILGDLLLSGDLASQDSADVRQRLLDSGILPADINQIMPMLRGQNRMEDIIKNLFASGYQPIVSEPLQPWSPDEWALKSTAPLQKTGMRP